MQASSKEVKGETVTGFSLFSIFASYKHLNYIMLSNLNKYHIILASKSPRRQELLRGMGVDFEILTKETPEDYPADLPLDEVPKYLSLQKSLVFANEELPADYLLITSDTVVICEGEILGKPKDKGDAARMLRLLSGKTHHVVTGVTVRSAEKTESFAVRSNVTFAELDAEEIDYYIEHCKPFDKAGAYGIQEWIGYVGISGLEGSFYNVMGLPTRRLYQCLKGF
jgi:septum formation protein